MPSARWLGLMNYNRREVAVAEAETHRRPVFTLWGAVRRTAVYVFVPARVSAESRRRAVVSD